MEDWAKLAMSSSVPVFASIDLIVNLDDMQKATLKTKAASLFSFRCGFLWLGVYNLVLSEIG